MEHNEKAKNVWRAVLFIISTRRRLSLVSIKNAKGGVIAGSAEEKEPAKGTLICPVASSICLSRGRRPAAGK